MPSNNINKIPIISAVPDSGTIAGGSPEHSSEAKNAKAKMSTIGERKSPSSREMHEVVGSHNAHPATTTYCGPRRSAEPARPPREQHRGTPSSPTGVDGPPTVRLEVVIVEGDEGRWLATRQAAVIRTALTWFATNPTDPQEAK